jgi:hypothetical protein
VFPEYLVNFNYLVQLMDEYGFQITSNEDAKRMGLPAGTGMFEELYQNMMRELNPRWGKSKKQYDSATDMSEDEQKISFLNRYFVFKKMRDVNTDSLYKIVYHRASTEIHQPTTTTIEEKEETTTSTSIPPPPPPPPSEIPSSVPTIVPSKKTTTKKLKNKLTICSNAPPPPPSKPI